MPESSVKFVKILCLENFCLYGMHLHMIISMQRLKDKLGTRQLPTAELLLDGTIAYKVWQYVMSRVCLYAICTGQ